VATGLAAPPTIARPLRNQPNKPNPTKRWENSMREKEPQFTVTDGASSPPKANCAKAAKYSSPAPQPIRPEAVAPGQAVQVEVEEPEVMDGDETIPEPTAAESAQQKGSTMPPRAD